MKKIWVEPKAQVAQFAANSYVSSCVDATFYQYFCNLFNKRVFFESNNQAGLQDNNTVSSNNTSVSCLFGGGFNDLFTNGVKSDAEFMDRLLNGSWDYDQRFWQQYSDDHVNATLNGGPLGQNDFFGHSAELQNHTVKSSYAYEVYNGYYYDSTETYAPAYLFYDRQNGVIHASKNEASTFQGRNRS